MGNGQQMTDRKPAGNSTFAIGGVSCSADSFVVAESSVLRMNICAEKPTHRKSANRYGAIQSQTTYKNQLRNRIDNGFEKVVL